MKTKSFALPLAAFFFAATICARAADDKPAPSQQDADAPMQARVAVLMLSMPEEKFLTLLPDLKDKVKIEKMIPDLLDAVKRREITLEGFPMVVTKSGQRAVMETGLEIKEDQDILLDPPKIYTRMDRGYFPVTFTTPTAFEVRNYGIVLEVEPVIGPDGTLIDLNLAPQHVELLGYRLFTLPNNKDIDGATGKDIHVPIAFCAKVVTSISLRSGQHALLGVYKKEKPAGTVEIFIISAEVITAGK